MRIRNGSSRSVALISLAAFTVAAAQTPSNPPTPTSSASEQLDKSPVLAANSVVTRDIAYVQNAGEQQKLDVYSPNGAKDAAVVLWVHGGEWTKGDKSEVSYKPKFFNENGIVLVSVNYRLSGTAKHPAQVEDVAAAVRWAKDSIARFGGDPAKLTLMGHSAGCHIVTLTGLDPAPLAKVGLKPSDLAGVVSWSGGAFDLVEKVRAGGMYADYIHLNFGDDEDAWRRASPMNHTGDIKQLPPFLFASAEQGNPGSREASEKMVALIRAAGGQADALLLAGKTHQTANHDLGASGDASGEALLRFIRQ